MFVASLSSVAPILLLREQRKIPFILFHRNTPYRVHEVHEINRSAMTTEYDDKYDKELPPQISSAGVDETYSEEVLPHEEQTHRAFKVRIGVHLLTCYFWLTTRPAKSP